jgi:transcriptional regulator with XRE-family HTH domain
MTRRDHGEQDETNAVEDRVLVTQSAVGARLRHVRDHHPEGPLTQTDLAERSGVSLRTIAALESAEGANVRVDTLLKITYSLGITREAYLLDPLVFQEVNRELDLSNSLRKVKELGVEKVLLRTSSGVSSDAMSNVSDLLQQIMGAAAKASEALQPQPEADESDLGQR